MTITNQHADCTTADPFFEPLKRHVIASTGLAYYCRRDAEMAKHFARRFREINISDCESYLRLLQNGVAGERELDCLIELLTIGETYFFRHPQLFESLERTILPDVIERNKRHRRLRIWSAGSSIGAEAYSVSIVLRRRLVHLIRDWDVTIIGTDINRTFLDRAAAAVYEDWALRGVNETVKQECFLRCDKSWLLKPEFRKGVTFQYHNLVDHPFPSMLNNLFAFDVILCRNVMIYFSPQQVAQLIPKMRHCLVDAGWLLVGHAEHTPESFRDFRRVSLDGATAYQRADGSHGSSLALPPPQLHATLMSESPSFNVTVPNEPGIPLQRRFHPRDAAQHAGIGPSAELETIRLLADRGEIESAATRCENLLKLNKLEPVYYLHHALLLEQMGRFAECEQALRRAIYLDRGFVAAHYYLGLSMQRLGRNSDAARSYRNCRRILADMKSSCLVNVSDGLTVAEFDEMARIQLESIK